MAEMKNLQQLLKHELEDLYSAEIQIIDAIPRMIEGAQDRLLKKALTDHLKVTRKQKERLDRVKNMLGSDKKEEMNLFQRLFSKEEKQHCKAMEGLIKEGEKLMGEDMERGVKDAAIIAAAQKIEHYEISGYGTAKAYAIQLGLKKVEQLLNETLNEEYESDDLLTLLAVGKVNLEANGQKVKGLKKIPGKRATPGKASNGNTTPASSRTKTSTRTGSAAKNKSVR